MIRHRALLLVVAASMPAACTRVGAPSTPEPPPAVEAARPPVEAVRASFAGYATLTGHRFPMALTVTGVPGAEVAATLDAPEMKMEAVGQGRWEGDTLTLELTYGTTCPGTLRIRVQKDDQGRLQGALSARDCTGRAEGPLELAPVG